MLQRFVARFRAPANANGSRPWYSHENRATLSKVEDCPCSDGVRRTAYIQGEPDTAWTTPALVSVQGKPARGYITGTEGGVEFRFYVQTREAFGLPEVDLNPETGAPVAWRRYAVSVGNGNDGLSRLFPNFTLDCHPDAIWDVARLAILSTRWAGRAYLADAVQVDECGEGAVQASISNPPRSPGWCDANGAWLLIDVYPADEVSETWEGSHHLSPAAAFGRAAAKL